MLMMRFRNLTFSTLFLLVPVIIGHDLSDKEVDICRDLGFIVNSGLTTIKFSGDNTRLQLVVNCPVTPDIWCRVQFGGDCYCISHNDSLSNTSEFSKNMTFSENGISLLVNQTEFRQTFAGSFIGCAVDQSIYRAFHISAAYTVIRNDVSDNSEARRAAVNTIIVCLTSILVCIGPCFVLTFISKWRQEQLKQKTMESERECDNGARQVKLQNDSSKLSLFGGQRANSADSQAILLSLKNVKRSTSSSVASIYSLNGECFFKQERIAVGRFAEYWKGVYTGSLPCGAERNTVCIKVSKCGFNEKALLAEADFLKQIPPNDHIINYFPAVLSKGDGMVSLLELAIYGDLYSFLCAKKKAMVTHTNEHWAKLAPKMEGCVQMCAYVTTTPPKLNINIPELLDDYITSQPFSELMSQPLSELDFSVFAHQIAMGMQHLSSLNILHKRLTSESVLIFENFVLKIADFGINETSEQTEKLSIAPAIQRNKNIERTPSGRPIIKWQAPEVMKNENYSSESDMWSYGMTLWEIVSYGETPFDHVVIRLLLKAIDENHYPLKPENCNSEMYNLMKLCWKPKGDRLSYHSILQRIHDHLVVQYISPVMFDAYDKISQVITGTGKPKLCYMHKNEETVTIEAFQDDPYYTETDV